MDVKVIDLPAVSVAYLRYKGPPGAAIGDFWLEVFSPWQQAAGLQGRTTYGVGVDDPATTAPEEYRYDTCVEIEPGYRPQAPARLAELPGGRFAVASFSGTGEQIPAAWGEFFGQWLPASGLQMDARPCFERYPADYAMDPATGVFACELCISVK
ncbi:GyrI-like domain-containing protein [Rugamonas sp. CCM 8940]|uniref:AraC family transcriptional regulator n=1 Tax=Rugamonas sp. CCM 8940 TaxID=2765359 RepID=UPI0018F545E6|nr:GyrI-like domain-containing protein [Rugamonas sp. CCM 8940]MBJ7313548.1 GyrI-like domain-containing protein [Rugamonas sp. CCM 8940]